MYSGTPEKSKKDEHEVQGTADVPPALFGISHHGIDRHRLLTEELYLAQNSSRSNTQTQNAHPGHRATEVVLGEGRNERRNVTPGVTGKLDENMPALVQGAVAAASTQVASTKKITKIKTGQQPTTTSNAKNQSPRVVGRQVCPPEQATRKDLPAGPFQKLNTQRLKQMLKNSGSNARKIGSLKVDAKESSGPGSGAAAGGRPLYLSSGRKIDTEQMVVTPSPLIVDKRHHHEHEKELYEIEQKKSKKLPLPYATYGARKNLPTTSPPDCAPGQYVDASSSLQDPFRSSNVEEFGSEAMASNAGGGMAGAQGPTALALVDGLKPRKTIEKIQLKAISAERKRNLHDKLEPSQFRLRLSKMDVGQAKEQGETSARIEYGMDGNTRLLEVAEGLEAGRGEGEEEILQMT